MMRVPVAGHGEVSALVYEERSSGEPNPTLVLAHGAGAGQRSRFMVGYARALAERGLRVVTFDFPYIERGRRVPDRADVLEACYRSVIDTVRERQERSGALFIGAQGSTAVAWISTLAPVSRSA